MTSASDHDPQLPVPAPGGWEPMLAGQARAADVLRPFVPGHLYRDFSRNCRNRPLADWWAGCRRGDLMAHVVPVGRPGSEARRKAALLACRIVRLSPVLLTTVDARPRSAVESVERWARGDPAVTRENLRHAHAVATELHIEETRAVNQAIRAGVRGGEGLRGRLGRLASAAAHACAVLLEPDGAQAHIAGAAAAVAGSVWRGGPADPASVDARDRLFEQVADLIRSAFPDIAAALAERQAEMNAG